MEHVRGLFEAEQKIKQLAPPRRGRPYGVVGAGRSDPAEKGCPSSSLPPAQGTRQGAVTPCQNRHTESQNGLGGKGP